MKNDKEFGMGVFAGKAVYMEGASGNDTDYLNYKSADHIVSEQESVKKNVWENIKCI